MTDELQAQSPTIVRYRVAGMDCGNCAAEIKEKVGKVKGATDVAVSVATQTMTLQVEHPNIRPQVERAVRELGYGVERVDSEASDSNIDDELPKDLSHVTPSYRRALWIVVLLNVGYGIIEIVAGYFAGSQALKADALDFFGDGMITFLGLVAIKWSLNWRARMALLQGIFLGALGLTVLGTTFYRIFIVYQPEAEIMGLFGGIALIVNVTAALVLIPHRTGDANVRAVWLFSRNDAIGNLAVVIAAGLVAWTATPWPDLVVALIIAGLFLHSSWSIIRDAAKELKAQSVRQVADS